jgi:hypothetical protein
LAGAACILSVAGLTAAAQQKAYPVFTPDDFVRMMKSVGQNFAAVDRSTAQQDFESAKGQLTRSREQLAVTITFWRDRKRDDAIKMLRTTLTRMDQLDDALSAEKIDPAAAAGIVKQVQTACEACHAVYRDQDPASKAYRFKAGVQ